MPPAESKPETAVDDTPLVKATARSAAELDAFLDLLHDQTFDGDEARLDEESRILTIPFECERWQESKLVRKLLFLKRARVPVHHAKLRIRHANSVEVLDPDRIGSSPLNLFEFRAETGQLILHSCTSITVNVAVSKLEVEVEVSGTVAEWRERWTF